MRETVIRLSLLLKQGELWKQSPGFVEHIVYRNEENGYTVLNLASNEEDEVTCVGVFQMISEGESLELTGEYTVHPSYGPQFKVQQYSIKAPEDIASIERYLGSGAIKGVGAALAARIVRKFKEDTFRIIEEEPERLAEIKGISERKAQEIAQQTEEKRELRQAMIFLQNYGISLSLAVKIYQTYQLDMYRIIQENPYRMAEDVTGVGFKIADEIAHRVGTIWTRISVFAVGSCMCFSRLRWKDTRICRKNCSPAGHVNSLEWMLPGWKSIIWIWPLIGN